MVLDHQAPLRSNEGNEESELMACPILGTDVGRDSGNLFLRSNISSEILFACKNKGRLRQANLEMPDREKACAV